MAEQANRSVEVDQEASRAENPTDADVMREVGRHVRHGRARRGMTRRQLAAESGISERYLAQIETGQGNPSLMVLKAIAETIEVAMADLLPRMGARATALTPILDLLARAPQEDLPAIADLIAGRLAPASAGERGGRIGLVGLRGAGKSTLGRRLADHLGCPFVELNQVIEQEHGASVQLLIDMSGLGAFRRYERACLEQVLARHDSAVIATAGGIVSNADTYALLLRRTHTVWIRARPEEHMRRVIEQGDFRPMAQNREAMADLVSILEARRADYARADAELDTSGESVAQSLARLLQIARLRAEPGGGG